MNKERDSGAGKEEEGEDVAAVGGWGDKDEG